MTEQVNVTNVLIQEIEQLIKDGDRFNKNKDRLIEDKIRQLEKEDLIFLRDYLSIKERETDKKSHKNVDEQSVVYFRFKNICDKVLEEKGKNNSKQSVIARVNVDEIAAQQAVNAKNVKTAEVEQGK